MSTEPLHIRIARERLRQLVDKKDLLHKALRRAIIEEAKQRKELANALHAEREKNPNTVIRVSMPTVKPLECTFHWNKE